MLGRGADGDEAEAGEQLREAHRAAAGLGAVPLRDAVAVLARRARIALDEPAGPAGTGVIGSPNATGSPGGAAPGAGDGSPGGGGSSGGRGGSARQSLSPLTPREHEVLGLLSEGYTNRQIGVTLFISEKTASVHVSNILAKLGAGTRGEAVALARKRSLV
jgi:DNA-binding CsgD family transcriptional regulator